MINTIFEKLKQPKNLPQLPQVMLKLIKACNNEKVGVDELRGRYEGTQYEDMFDEVLIKQA